MKRLLVVLIATLGLSAGLAAAQDDEAAIRKLSNDFFAAWGRHDVKTMAATFAEDGEVINPFGRVAKGRAAIETLFTDEHAGSFKGTSYTASVSLKMLAPTVAFGDWTSSITGMLDPAGKALPAFEHHVAVAYVKKNGHWLAAEARPYAFLHPPQQ